MFSNLLFGRNEKVAVATTDDEQLNRIQGTESEKLKNLSRHSHSDKLSSWIMPNHGNIKDVPNNLSGKSSKQLESQVTLTSITKQPNNKLKDTFSFLQLCRFLDFIPCEICIANIKDGDIVCMNHAFQSKIFLENVSNMTTSIFDIFSVIDKDRFYESFEEFRNSQEKSFSGNYLTRMICNDAPEDRLYNWSLITIPEFETEYVLLTGQSVSSETLYTQIIEDRYEEHSIYMINKRYYDSTVKMHIERDGGSGSKTWKTVKESIAEKTRKKIELKEAQMKLSLMEGTLETKRMFVRYVSHEVRTPLNVVVSGLQILSGILDAEHSEALGIVEDIRSACSTAVDILNDILTYEKLDSNILTIQKEDCNIVSIVEQVYAMFQLQARQSNIHLQFNNDLADSIVTVVGDSTKLAQVVRNIVSNAVKFTPDGGKITLSLRIQERERQGGGSRRVRLEVQDTGPGMRREERRKLFNEVIQFNPKELQNGQGSGLGLFLARKIVDMHDGSIGVDVDWAGPGSIFYLELPVTAISRVAPKLSTKSRRVSLIPEPTKMLKLLLVDDAVLVRKFHKRVLSPHCDEIVEAANGKEAVERVQEARRGEARPFDGILMDSSMPFMDGPTATRLIREQLGYRGLIFGVTGNAFQSDIDTFIESGVNEVITKPLGEEKYAYIIRAILQL